MKNIFLNLCLILFLTLLTTEVVHAQKYMDSQDSLEAKLKEQKTLQGKILILQQLVDSDPIDRGNENYLEKLLQLDGTGKSIDIHTYLVLQKAQLYTKIKQFSKAKEKLEQVVNVFDKQHKVLTWYLNALKDDYDALGDPDARFKYFQQKLENYQVNGPYENTAICYLAIAGYYRYQAAYNQSINYYLKAAFTFKKIDLKLYVNQLVVIANEYSDWGNTDRALYYLKLAEPIIIARNYTSLKWGFYYTLGRINAKDHHYSEAIDAYNNAVKYETDNDPKTHHLKYMRGIACCLTDQAIAYVMLNQPQQALQNLQRAEVIIDSGKFYTISSGRVGYLEYDYAFYKYYRQTGDLLRAEQSLHAANQMASKGRNLHFKLIYLKEAADFYEFEKKSPQALQAYRQYFALLDTTNQKQAKFKIAQYEIDQKDEQQQQHINELKQQKTLQDYQIGRRNILLWGSLVVLVLVIGLLVFIYRQLFINRKTLATLKNTQLQLIQSAKMASLGELTAGIAHEIQNPLNFVNNFSEVNTEMIDEQEEELKKGNIAEALAIAADIRANQEKINYHGKRAEFIVKGMLEHSRTGTGEKQLTNFNVLADEFLKLSYHGLRAKDKDFNAELITRFEEHLPKINMAQQDIGRVLLNLFNNAFYAVTLKKKTAETYYKPEVTVSTSAEKNKLIIKVKDNGNGIPEAIKDKIMQPFFTTKPTGEGTGLGLSLSYDIVVKGHGGTIELISQEGEGSEFVIKLPLT